MKKSLFMMGVAIAALSSCTQNEVLDIAESNTIQFGKSYIGKPTRANIISVESELNSFYVLGKVKEEEGSFSDLWTSPENVYLVETENNLVWKYENIKKYVAANTYAFAAYSDAGKNGQGSGALSNTIKYNNEANPQNLTISNYVTNGKDNDLVVSISNSSINSNDQKVSFGFRHALSQIKFTLSNPLIGTKIVISDFNLVGFKDNANLTYTLQTSENPLDEFTWTLNGDTNKEVNYLNSYEASENIDAEGIYTVIPQTLTSLKVSFKATLYKDNGEGGIAEEIKNYTDVEIPLESIQGKTLKPGYIYNFKAVLNMGYIYFDDIKVDEWLTNEPSIDIPQA